MATLSTVNIICPVDVAKWPQVFRWYCEMTTRPAYMEANVPGLNKLRTLVKQVAKFDIPDAII